MMNGQWVRDIIGWDVRNWSRCLSFWEQYWPNGEGKKVLELGTRSGGLSLWMAGKGAEVVCSDLDNPRDRALPLHLKYGVSERITYAAINATDIGYKDYFDVIVFMSVLGGVGRDGHPERQKKVLSEIRKALKPGGFLFFAENLAASPIHRYLRTQYVRWGKSWRYMTVREVEDFLKDYTKFCLEAHGFWGAFGRNETQRHLLGCVDAAVDFMIPPSWKYILFGAAQK